MPHSSTTRARPRLRLLAGGGGRSRGVRAREGAGEGSSSPGPGAALARAARLFDRLGRASRFAASLLEFSGGKLGRLRAPSGRRLRRGRAAANLAALALGFAAPAVFRLLRERTELRPRRFYRAASAAALATGYVLSRVRFLRHVRERSHARRSRGSDRNSAAVALETTTGTPTAWRRRVRADRRRQIGAALGAALLGALLVKTRGRV